MIVVRSAQLTVLPNVPARFAKLGLLVIAPIVLLPLLLPYAGLDGSTVTDVYKHWIVNLALAAAAVSVGLRAAFVRRERVAWTLLAVAIGGYAVAQVYWAFWLEPHGNAPFPSICDGFWLALYPLGCTALILIARERLLGGPQLWLDGFVGGAALAAVGEAFAFDRIIGGTEGLGPFSRAVALAYPIGDLVLIATVAGVFALTGWRPGRFWALLGGGFALVAVADTVYTTMLAGGVTSTTIATNALWTLGLVAVGFAAWIPPVQHRLKPDAWRVLLAPSIAAALALGTLVYAALADVNTVAIGLAALAIVGGIVRAVFTFGELRTLAHTQLEAVTDPLTGLGNRRLLMRELDDALTAGHPFWLAVLDLDGFKLYNDTFGHSDGDLMLARLAKRLRGVLEGHGRAYRLGGDEFCVIVSDGKQGQAVVEAAQASLQEPGREFAISCSCGIARVPQEADDVEDALRLADSRMYAEKNSRPDAAKHQAADVALGILSKAHPNLSRHIDHVAELCMTVGRELRLAGPDLDDLAQAADLHDVGKVAIPSRILDKEGALDEDEWEWMRRHTLIGERMLAVAPALRGVAAIVRSTHERFDGKGYPDGLSGNEIPLAARIIAVCDSFDAMVSDRVYRNALPLDHALGELADCAGTQFDPGVVKAFLATYPQALAIAV